jgi:cob(I)alamin adenosyltransferase
MATKIYTRGGDRGCTNLGDGTRVTKDSERCEAYGTLDEANALLGLALTRVSESRLRRILEFAANRIYNCASRIAAGEPTGDATVSITEDDVVFLETAIDGLQDELEPLSRFILPTGTETAALLHVARATVRRAERRIVTLSKASHVSPTLLKFVNRLSDLLFVATRYANNMDGTGDVPWDKDLRIPDLSDGD